MEIFGRDMISAASDCLLRYMLERVEIDISYYLFVLSYRLFGGSELCPCLTDLTPRPHATGNVAGKSLRHFQ